MQCAFRIRKTDFSSKVERDITTHYSFKNAFYCGNGMGGISLPELLWEVFIPIVIT